MDTELDSRMVSVDPNKSELKINAHQNKNNAINKLNPAMKINYNTTCRIYKAM